MKVWITVWMAVLIPSVMFATDLPGGLRYYSTEARDGDGVFTLLRRYDLLIHDCNIDKFYELNQLDSDDGLVKGRSYYLPIAVFNYNGISIRSTIGMNDWDKAIRIQQFNENTHKNGLRKEDYRKDKMLWVPYHELHCEGNVQPVLKADSIAGNPALVASEDSRPSLRVPIFGHGYENIKIRNDYLKNKVYYLVSGHGGPDPGAMSICSGHTLCEDEYAYDVTLRLARNLMEQGATVHIIIQDEDDGIRDRQYLDCDKEETLLGEVRIPLNQLQRLSQRTQAINRLYHNHLAEGIRDHTVICIHVDSRSPRHRQDVFFYYFDKSKTGRKLANNLQKTFAEKYRIFRPGGHYHGTVSSRGLYMLRNTDPPAVYVELANIRNELDRKRILPESNRQALANWLCEGLMQSLD